MQLQTIVPGPLTGVVTPPADKSISHRALLFSALAGGESQIVNLLQAQDVETTQAVLRQLGVNIKQRGAAIIVEGKDGKLQPTPTGLDCGNSGTTMRLLAGILAGQAFTSVLVGDSSLSKRPMERILIPLCAMGAKAFASPTGSPPVLLRGGNLRGIEYALPVASAQLKSALLLAALQAEGETILHEPALSRDHTERMLASLGVSLRREGLTLILQGPQGLRAGRFIIPGDFSSAAPWLVAALVCPGSHLLIKNVGLNPTRTGLLHILQRMGAGLIVRERGSSESGEPWGDIEVRSQDLRGTEVVAAEIPLAIDEIPLLVVAACFAQGVTRINGAQELRAKESDRITNIVRPLLRMGAKIQVDGDDILIEGQGWLQGATVEAAGDHRIAMALAVAGSAALSPVQLMGAEWVQISYPTFWAELARLQEGARCDS
ncbi:MAG: 3-phosphoshikimate 1-carboxyvinyltransferase [Firmicutes bacterium]|nr:3-phosphoshikimate 1-carboxyvinyltransferase [Bacillota bacterium]